MKIHFTGRQMDVSEAMKEHVTEKLEKVTKYWNSIKDINVILSVEKYRHIAEISVQGKPFSIKGVEVTNDMYASVGAVVDKLERQAIKQKKKLQDHKKRRGGKEAINQKLQSLSDEFIEQEEMEGVDPSMEMDEADEHEEEMDQSGSSPQVVQSNSFEVKPMSVEEAALHLIDSPREFLVYRNADSERINVLFKRSDGNYGLIDPDA